ncbi:hypothetical protein M3215_12565 [Bacillus cytotoxicus]|uniref:Uncharacterized protein n=1 Tax=Bacillus cytotoxicus TaxID=580165 RepID=A0ACC6A6U8_9BACI|nr:hypothetical protein [Bacillus cytotoxicus]
MYQNLYEQLTRIKDTYEQIGAIGEQIYEHLQQKKLADVQSLHTRQLQHIEQVKQLTHRFQETIEMYCKEKGIETTKVHFLFSYFSNEEIKKIEELQKNMIELEENIKMVLLKNQYYLNVLLKTTESIVDSVSEFNLERNHNSQIFMNELL